MATTSHLVCESTLVEICPKIFRPWEHSPKETSKTFPVFSTCTSSFVSICEVNEVAPYHLMYLRDSPKCMMNSNLLTSKNSVDCSKTSVKSKSSYRGKSPVNSRRNKNTPLNSKALELMKTWYESNISNPYPSKEVLGQICKHGNISVKQVKNWMTHKRTRSNNVRRRLRNI